MRGKAETNSVADIAMGGALLPREGGTGHAPLGKFLGTVYICCDFIQT